MKDDRSPGPEFEERLRAALHADAARIQVSPEAWAKVRSRLANRTSAPVPRARLLRRRLRWGRLGGLGKAQPHGTALDPLRPLPAGRPHDQRSDGWRSRMPRHVVVGMAVLASAAATTAVLLIPQLTTPSQMAGPSGVAGPDPSMSTGPTTDAGADPSARPTPTVTSQDARHEGSRPRTLASVTAGTNLRVVLDHDTSEGDTTVWVRLFHLKDGAWRAVDKAVVVGATNGRAAANAPKVCELTVDTTAGVDEGKGAADQTDSPTVRVRLAADTSTSCSRAYDFHVRGGRLLIAR